MPEEFLLSYVSFDSDNQPFLEYIVDSEIRRTPVFGQDFSHRFDFSRKFCCGWVDFENRCSVVCPDAALVDTKYENCLKCRQKTGFNPAFYNADSVSPQQEKINSTPHFLYLAYFAPGVIKVGISQEARGIRRLLEQGARSALRLETFPTALIARQYEARIAGMNGFVENLPQSKKMELILREFDPSAARDELMKAKGVIETNLDVQFESSEIIKTAKYFYPEEIDITHAKNVSGQGCIVGKTMAMVGPILITEHDGNLLVYNLKKYLGYRAEKTTSPEVNLPEEQLSLF